MILSKKSVILILLSVFIINAASISLLTYLPKYLDFLSIERPLIQLIITIFPLTAFVFPPLYGYFSDKIQKRHIFILFGSIGMPLIYFLLLLTQNLFVIILLLFIFGFFMTSSNLLLTLFAELVEDDKAFISYFNASTVAGWFVGAQSVVFLLMFMELGISFCLVSYFLYQT